jgi:hypothetical protein
VVVYRATAATTRFAPVVLTPEVVTELPELLDTAPACATREMAT